MIDLIETDEVKRIEPTAARNRGGEWVRLGLEEYRIPPLALQALQDLEAEVKSLGEMGAVPSAGQMRTVGRLVHAAMVRNYPALSAEEVTEMLDMGNYASVLGAVLQISGFERRAAADGAGERRASTGA